MPDQLRVYQALPGQAESFAREWREQVAPLIEHAGYEILGLWAGEEDRVVILLSVDDLQAVGARYGEARKAASIDPDPVRLLDTAAPATTVVIHRR